MKKEEKKIDWKGWGILGIIGYLLSLPILLWKSSRIGKLIFILGIVTITLSALGKASDVFFLKFRYRLRIEKELEPVKERIENIKTGLTAMEATLNEHNRDLQAKAYKEIDSISKKLNTKYSSIMTKFDEVEKALELYKEKERQLLKEKIILLKEDVKVNKKSIESAEIRLQCEELVEHLSLLTSEERGRFYQDLEDIGFGLEQIEDDYYKIYTGSYSMVSYDTVYYEPSRITSTDAIYMDRR